KTTDRNGSVAAALQVTEESDVMIITHNGKVIRVHANEIREAGRSTQGVRLLRLDEDDSVAAAAVLQEENEEEKKELLFLNEELECGSPASAFSPCQREAAYVSHSTRRSPTAPVYFSCLINDLVQEAGLLSIRMNIVVLGGDSCAELYSLQFS